MKFAANTITQSLALILGINGYAFADEQPQQTQDNVTEETIVIVGQQNSYLNPQVSTATKTDIDPLDTPSTVNVINQQFLQDIRATTLEDAYGYTTGLTRSGVAANSFTLRGMPADLNTIQVNGLPGLASRFGSPTTANVEQVEILKGPASIMYGQIQPGGMVNIITKKPQDVASVSYDISARTYTTDVSGFGEDNGFTGTIDATGPLNASKTWMYRMIISGEDADSYRNDVDEQNYYLFPTLTYRPSTLTELTFGLELQSEQRVADNGIVALNNGIGQAAPIDTHYQSADDTDEDKGIVAFATFTTALANDFDLTVDWRSVWHEDSRELYETRDVNDATQEVSVRDRDQVNKREYHFVDVRTTGSVWTGNVEHQLLFGGNIGLEKRDFLRETYATTTVDFDNPQDTSDRDESSYKQDHRITDYTNYGLYVQDTVYLNEHWTLMGGLRYTRQDVDFDYVSKSTTDTQSTDAFVSQAGIVYKVVEGTSLYASYGESFNPNSVEKKDVNDDAFDPEEGSQYEVGTKTNLINDRTNLTVAYFDIEKSNVVDKNDNGDYELLGAIRSKGIETELLAMPLDNWQVKLGYAYVDSEISENPDASIQGNRTPMTAYHDAYVWTKYNFPYQVAGGVVGTTLGANYEGARYTSEDPSDRVELPAYVTVDIGVHYEVNEYRASLNVENLFDEEYYVGGTDSHRLYTGDPRNITLSFSGKF
ncbi:TonB-dependent siderophore receptor [Vibrio splendidus]|uniref:TonB-dependent siderophore receptor n=1 Tax=Vibrio splendidus TaxID=29497 RepID=UPI00246857B5|nr:TonB-dependent siderophore receptor [Vibrio splendidus]MDH5903076.1 TonB-dependent siderophore receptor [Vibrio splendidus]